MTLLINISIKGGPGSGNWGHRGIPGRVGGSSPRGAGMSPTSGKDWLQRYEKKTGKKHPTAEKKPEPTIRPEPKIALSDKGPQGGQPAKPNARAAMVLNRGLRGKAWSEATEADDLDVKLAAIYSISAETGVSDDDVFRLVESWAHTSNDNDPMALSLQQAASEEFGIPLSDWQKGKIKSVEASTGKSVSGDISREAERAVLRSMYDHTQASLKMAGYRPGDTIPFSRGVGADAIRGPVATKGTKVNYIGNAMEAWTASVDIARDFEAGATVHGLGGMVLSMSVPIENIFSSPITGFGQLTLGEFVILGTVADNMAYVV